MCIFERTNKMNKQLARLVKYIKDRNSIDNESRVLAAAAHMLKLEGYTEDEHGPCTRMARKFMKHFIFLSERNGRDV